jgi:hypothetical chaperone protein
MIHAVDFGTSNSLLGAATPQDILPVAPLDPAAADSTVLRSLMYFGPKQAPAFGEEAILRFVDNGMSGRFLRSFKRFLPLKGFEGTLIDGRHWSLEDLVSRFLREMRERAQTHYGVDCDSLVLGRPAAFSEEADADALAQLRLETAARSAGYKHIEFLAEPVAAAYRFRQEMKHEEIVLVADFGGGTSDYTVLKLSKKDFRPEDVLAVGGAPTAGDALDGALMKHRVAHNFGSEVRYKVPFGSNVMSMPKGLAAHLNSTAHINFLNSRENREFLSRVKSWSLHGDDAKALDQLAVLLENQLGFAVFEAIEAAKRILSADEQTRIAFEYPGIKISEKVTRKQFRVDTQDESARIFAALDATLERAGLRPEQIDRVCCTGGTAKALPIREGLLKRFPEERLLGFRHFTSIVEGLCERARQIQQ